MRYVNRTISFKKDLYSKLKNLADKKNLTITGLIRMILSEYLDKVEG